MDVRVAEQFAVPTGKIRGLAQFNKLSKTLVGLLVWVDPATLNSEFFVYHEIEMDFETEMVVGTADDFQIVKIEDLPEVVHEEALDMAATQRITKEYPLVQQINVFARAIQKLSEVAGVEQTELDEMLAYIDEIKRENAVRKAFFKESPDYVYKSYEDHEREYQEQLEGGLHEAYGGRVVTGGRVF